MFMIDMPNQELKEEEWGTDGVKGGGEALGSIAGQLTYDLEVV